MNLKTVSSAHSKSARSSLGNPVEGGPRQSSGQSIPAAPNMNASVPSIESSAKSFKSACLDRATHKNKVDEKLKAIFEPKQKSKKHNSTTNASKNLTS